MALELPKHNIPNIMVQDVSKIRVAHAGMEASGRGFLRPLWGGDSSSMNLLSRRVGGLPGSSGIPLEGTTRPLGL